MPTVITQGAASAKGYGFGARSVAANYIEDVFSTYLYTGNSTSGGTQTITNGVDLSTKGGMVWIKGRSATANNVLFDTARGAGTTASNNQAISSNLTTAEDLGASYDFLSAFNADGFTVKQGGTSVQTRGTNYDATTYASWTFRKQAKFFDVVTYTGNATARTISHNLGSAPGCIIVKRTSALDDWYVYHRSLTSAAYSLILNTTGGQTLDTLTWNNTAPTSTSFSVGGVGAATNVSGATYVAYLFAHDAGGFGAAGTDNVISCGSFTTNGSGDATITLGYEPQWILFKRSSGGNWYICDVNRGMAVGTFGNAQVYPNLSDAEITDSGLFPTSTGFAVTDGIAASSTYIYIAIRRGPMKTPTSGTSVFSPISRTGTNTTVNVTGLSAGPSDTIIIKQRANTNFGFVWNNRLTENRYLVSNATDADTANSAAFPSSEVWDQMDGVTLGNGGTAASSQTNYNPYTYINYLFRRAPGFFDVVCYTGDGTTRTIKHNLGVVPEMIIVKVRSGGNESWITYVAPLGNTGSLFLNMNDLFNTGSLGSIWNNTNPTATEFTVVNKNQSNASGYTYVAYLFASCPGVSKVGSYTGTGTTKQIDCGFTGGARFVLVKRTNSTGDWYVWDSARGIVAGNDPYLLLNSTAAEVTGTDYVDTYSAGFEISSTAPAAINANGGSFIFLAIA